MDTPTVGSLGATPLRRPRSAGVQYGFSILEVLIAIIILSIGMLGAVGMQATALQANKETRNQAIATTFARELAEKMRGNHTVAIRTLAVGVNPYLFDVTLPSTPVVATPATNCFTAGCPLLEDAARWDVADWQSRVQRELPTPKVKVCFDQDPFDSAGKSRWACTDSGDIAVLKMSWNRKATDGQLVFTSQAESLPTLVIPLTAGSSQ